MKNVYFVSFEVFKIGDLTHKVAVGDINVFTSEGVIPSLPSIRASIADANNINVKENQIHLLAVTQIGMIKE